MNKTYTVSEITQYLKTLITNDIFLSSVYIRGEISNLKLHSSSHIYFTLKDDNCSIKAVMFANSTRILKFVPKDGMKVILHGYVTIYERAGQYQMTVSNIIPEGMGELYLAFEQLKEKLRLNGFFNEEMKKRIPSFPTSVAIVTSKTGAALKDFVNVATRRAKGIPIHVYDTIVQGQGAAKLIAEKIEYINKQSKAEVIVLARGGGSIEDLWPFNEEITAKAIFSSKIPVVTGVGHETDYTIADMVADMRAPTPSVAAELVFPDMFATSITISNIKEKISSLILARIGDQNSILKTLSHKTTLKKPNILIDRYKMDFDVYVEKLYSTMSTRLKFEQQSINGTISILNKINPLNILKKGFSFTTDAKNNNIDSIDKINVDDIINIKYFDGETKAMIKEVKKYE